MKTIIASVILLFAGAQTPSYDLIWKPKEGQKLVYALSVDGQILNESFKLSGNVHMDIRKVEPNGDYTLATAMKGLKAVFGGDEQSVPDEEEEVQKYNSKGELISEKKDKEDADPSSDMIGELFSRACDVESPEKPVNVGDTWTHDFPEDKKLNLPKAKGTYKLLSDTEGKLKISIVYEELSGPEPTSTKGVATLQKEDALPISVESDVKNIRFQEGIPAGSAKLSLAKK